MNRKFSAAILASTLLSAALPLATSAMTIGVSDEVNTSITSGHVCGSSSSYTYHSGVEWSNQSSSKTGTEEDHGTTSASVSDPAESSASNSGSFKINVSSNSGTAGIYSQGSNSSSSFNGQQAQTSIVNTVSAFANP